MFECGLVFVRHEFEWVSIFHVHRDGVRFTGFGAVFALADTVWVADEASLLDPSTFRLMKVILPRYKCRPLLFACVASHFDFSSFI